MKPKNGGGTRSKRYLRRKKKKFGDEKNLFDTFWVAVFFLALWLPVGVCKLAAIFTG